VQNVHDMPPATRRAFADFAHRARERLAAHEVGEADVATFLTRLERWFTDLHDPLERLYGDDPRLPEARQRVLEALVAAAAARAPELRALDYERELTPDWFQRETQVGGVCYVDLFAGAVQGVRERLPYLRDLGLTYLHLMPLLQARAGPNDGGYAVQDYRAVDARLGSVEDLRALAGDLRRDGMRLCLDLVLNHTAKEHAWARAAVAGDPEHLDYYLTFPDRALPDAYERTLPLVFPDFKPSNFTWVEGMAGAGRWVWTTFNEFQWDLNYANPLVFAAMLDTLLWVANLGADVLRLDAVPFMWKRLGTNCQNQPEVHELLQAFRAGARIATPAAIFKAEAIVSPHDLVDYLGQGRHAGRECELAYHNSLMVLLWSTLATRRVALMTHVLRTMPPVPAGTTWLTYVRGHDDIGWAVTEEDAAAVGENGQLHRRFLSEFYAGRFPGSFARGAVFQPEPLSGEGRTSGTTASLAGLERALEAGERAEVDRSLARIELLHSVAFSWGGVPLLYLGDELAQLNDHGYLADPAKAPDNRWLHRPPMDWAAAARRHEPGSVPGRAFAALRRLAELRRTRRALHGGGGTEAVWTDDPHVFAYVREHLGQRFLALANFADEPRSVAASLVAAHGLDLASCDVAGPGFVPVGDRLVLAPHAYAWLTGE
jgi:amylosucrase